MSLKMQAGKRCLALVLAALLMLNVPAFARAEAAETTPHEALLNEIARLLDVRESRYVIDASLLDALAAFAEKNDFASLAAGRAACGQAYLDLLRLRAADAFPTFSLSDAVLQSLSQEGVEVDALEAEFSNETQLDYFSTLSNCKSKFFLQAYYTSTLPNLSGYAAITRRWIEANCLYDANLVNLLLLELGDDPAAAAFWAGMPERWPFLSACRHEWEADLPAVYASTSACLETLTRLEADASALGGEDAYRVEQISKQIIAQDLDGLRADCNPIQGMPALLPLPVDWMQVDNLLYFAGDLEADGLPGSVMMVDQRGVSLEDYLLYVQVLKNCGAMIYQFDGDENAQQYILVFQGGVLMLQWAREEQTSLFFDPHSLTMENQVYYLLCTP